MNNSDISIEDVNLQLDKSVRHIEGKVQIIITLKNNSKTLIYYVPKRPRNIDYDQSGHVLSIGLYENEQVAILPDTTLRWQYLIPVWIKKIIRPYGLKEIVKVIDISGVQKVICTVACHTSPFRVETVSASFERTIIND